MNNLRCPRCGVSHIKKNGRTHYDKQNHKCLECGRQFVDDSQRVEHDRRELVRQLLLERIPLRGICRVVRVSLTWLLEFIAAEYEQVPDDLGVRLASRVGTVRLMRLDAEADELWSFVGSKANKQWVWIAMDATTRQIIAFHVGDRSHTSAEQLWAKLPHAYRQHATFYTDQDVVYEKVIPAAQHKAIGKLSPHNQSPRTVQQHVEATRCTAGPRRVVLFQEARQPYRSH